MRGYSFKLRESIVVVHFYGGIVRRLTTDNGQDQSEGESVGDVEVATVAGVEEVVVAATAQEKRIGVAARVAAQAQEKRIGVAARVAAQAQQKRIGVDIAAAAKRVQMSQPGKYKSGHRRDYGRLYRKQACGG